jgi:acetyltransferase
VNFPYDHLSVAPRLATTSVMNDPAIVSDKRSPLESFFAPKSVAVIGATDREGTVGRSVLVNLSAGGFPGKIYPVNPKRKEILGHPTFASVGEIPEPVDLAVVITPAPTVPGVVGECVDAGVRATIVISAGFKERGAEGAALEAKIQEQLRRSPMRLIGPNCLGVMNPILGLNATFAHDMARPGKVAFLSQSGALLTAILDWSLQEKVGFSAIVSTGSMLDVGWGDLIDFFGDDASTGSILLYMESVGDARSFLSAAREVALRKPIIVIKAGRTAAASKAASSHTGALTGSDEVFDAALRRCGVLRVSSIADLFHMAEILGKQPRPRGPRLTILTNAGGPGVLATDALLAAGGELAPLSDSTVAELNRFLPESWSHGNPIDILGDADPERYSKALEIAARDQQSNGLLAILAPQGMTDPAQVAERLKPHANGLGKPVLASWMGGATVADGVARLNAAGIPTFAYPDAAARSFTYMWKFSYSLKGIYETPFLTDDLESQSEAKSRVAALLKRVRATGRTILTEAESKQVLLEYGIPTVETRVAISEDEAVSAARSIGFPVVLKLHSETITHKSDVGGIQLDLRGDDAVRQAFRSIQSSVRAKAGDEAFLGVTVQPLVKLDGYELIVGSSIDPQFGPVILFGSGGQLVEVYKDRALALPPLNSTLATRLMEQTRIYRALQGVRGRTAVDMKSLENALVHFSRLVVEQPWIKEMDINPLLASPEKITALDARVLLHAPGTIEDQLPKPAILPYPIQYVSSFVMKNGTQVTVRPIRPEDEPAIAKFHETLSDRTVYLRYFHMEQLSTRVAHERLTRICFIDYAREMALVAVRKNPATGEDEIIAVGRLSRIHGTQDAEVAALVTDQFQNQGLGSALVSRLIQIARDEKLEHIVMSILMENAGMRALANHYEFKLQVTSDMSVVKAVLSL